MKEKTLLEEAMEVIIAIENGECPLCAKREEYDDHEKTCMLGKFLKKLLAENKRKLNCSQCEHGFTNPFDQFFCRKGRTGTIVCKEYSPKGKNK